MTQASKAYALPLNYILTLKFLSFLQRYQVFITKLLSWPASLWGLWCQWYGSFSSPSFPSIILARKNIQFMAAGWMNESMNEEVKDQLEEHQSPSSSNMFWNLVPVLCLMRLPRSISGWRADLFLLLWSSVCSTDCAPLMRGHSPRGLCLEANYFVVALTTQFRIFRLLLVFYISTLLPLSLSKGMKPCPDGRDFQGQLDGKHKLNWAGRIIFPLCLMCRWQYLKYRHALILLNSVVCWSAAAT